MNSADFQRKKNMEILPDAAWLSMPARICPEIFRFPSALKKFSFSVLSVIFFFTKN